MAPTTTPSTNRSQPGPDAPSERRLIASAIAASTGVASGFQTTCIQVGGAIGTAVLSALVASKVAPAVKDAGLPAEAEAAGAAGVTFDGLPAVNDAFVSGMHIGLVVAAGLCVAVAALVMIAVREPAPRDARTALEDAAAPA
ncbi:hypothetical protein [Aeromicrobium yanjiei]|uniref:MFS transporter n=1 Tax=Aeromicrobium yanjiei TaxID=2662028 RepID=A0A5Q2ME61_9ACTN|nr:hypothetical protein [Aeromicrobium yanjiei]QGG40123.1 hypothetical protein GEV26_01315 [Aeromicrobium yanjiei]